MTMENIGIILLLHTVGYLLFNPMHVYPKGSYTLYITFIYVLLYTCVLTVLNPVWGVISGLLHWPVFIVFSRVHDYYIKVENQRLVMLTCVLSQMFYICILIVIYDIVQKFNILL